MKQRSFVFAVVVGALLCAACQDKGPRPSAPPPPIPETPRGLTEAQQAAVDRVPRPEPDEAGNIDLGAMTVHIPEDWVFVKPTALLRRAQFDVLGEGGEAELIVFFMGKAGAGSVSANIERWIRQFSRPDGTEKVDVVPETSKISGFEVTRIDVAGNYGGGMTPSGQPGEEKEDQRLIAAIVDTPDGPYYVKLLGPNETVTENEAAFDAMLKSMKPNKTAEAPDPKKPADKP
ncbi:MAG: hypothetical protein AAF500_07315 [Myxococcota bacterium]